MPPAKGGGMEITMKALIAMSGGVDSSVAAQQMIKEGCECIGATMRLFDMPGPQVETAASDRTSWEGSAEVPEYAWTENESDAAQVAPALGMPYHVFDFSRSFARDVIEPFIDSYCHGRTPNPCVTCNRCLKFGLLFEKMKELGCDLLATGHYVRIKKDTESGRFLLRKAADPAKDQSYVLYGLTQEQLAHVRFPLGGMRKEDARGIAADSGFRNAGKADSQDICFIPDGDYAAFIERHYAGELSDGFAEGSFADSEGNILGRHKGIIHYTLGQRRGLGIPAASRLYVTKIDPETNTVVLGANEDLFGRELTAHQINLIPMERIEGSIRVRAKIRYRHTEQPAMVTQPAADTLHIVFDDPQRAATPGQSVVLYDGDLVIGGGVIC